MDKNTAEEIISQTKANYNRMAAEFSRTRGGLPQDLLALKEYIVPSEKVLDLGCGNGRFSALFAAKDYIGADASEELIKIAQGKFPDKQFMLVEPLKLPFADATFDKVFCLAVIHHMPSNEYRRQFLAEIKRVLKPNGMLILTSWYLLHQPKIWLKLIKMALLKLFRQNRMDIGDLLIPFSSSSKEVLAQRYIHTFSLAGLVKLCKSQGFIPSNTEIIKRNKNKNIQIIAAAKS